MKDNYGVTGKTISQQVTVLNQDQNPLIGGRTTTVSTTSTTVVTTQVTTKPETTIPTSVLTTPIPETTTITPSETMVVTTTEIPTLVTSGTSNSSPTYAPGFGLALVFVALVFGFVLISKK